MKRVEETGPTHQRLYQEILAVVENHMTTMEYEEILAVIGQVAGGFSILIAAKTEDMHKSVIENFKLGEKAAILKLDKLLKVG